MLLLVIIIQGGPHLQPMDGAGSLPPSAEPSTSTSDLYADKNPSHDLPASAQHVASGGGGGGGGGGDGEPEQSRGGAVGGATGGGGGGAGGKKKSSFERIVEKLAPVYPHYARYVYTS